MVYLGKDLQATSIPSTEAGRSLLEAANNGIQRTLLDVDSKAEASTKLTVGNYMSYGGTANAIELTSINKTPAVVYNVGDVFRFRATATNTGAATVIIDGLTIVNLKTVTGAALPAGYIRTDADTMMTYDGTNFIVDRQIERGSNANGNYTRFADGCLICEHLLISETGNTASGISYVSPPSAWVFPAGFLAGSLPKLSFSAARIASAGSNPISVSRATGGVWSSTEVSVILVWYSSSSATVSTEISLLAKGYWY